MWLEGLPGLISDFWGFPKHSWHYLAENHNNAKKMNLTREDRSSTDECERYCAFEQNPDR